MEEILIKERELRNGIAELINKAELPAIIIKPILKDMYDQINILEQQQYELALKNIKEKEEKKDE